MITHKSEMHLLYVLTYGIIKVLIMEVMVPREWDMYLYLYLFHYIYIYIFTIGMEL